MSERDRDAQLDAWLDRLLDAPRTERTKILESCEDAALRERLCTLLRAEADNGPLDETPNALARSAIESTSPTQHGVRIGAYRIASLLGEGGSATVWLATRDDGTITHDVAVKCLKSGLATPEQRARFVREQQILARLTHPNIARLYDVGINVDGVPYIVMERIDGQPITHWCDARELTIDDRLQLFRAVLAAAAFAHQNLVVHRDLKPGNILVNADGAPKLLDFGIAKLLGDSDDATRTQARTLTPGYAAPEQFSGGAITTATDVYALGIVLYELMCGGRPPRDDPSQELPTASNYVQQWRRRRGESEPHPADAAAHVRGCADATRLARALDGDLDALILMATAPDPTRRYTTIAAFDADIENYLQQRPLRARRTGAAYRMRKYVTRHWLAIGAAAAVMLALVIGSGLALWQAREAMRAVAHANAVQDFLLSVFETARPGPRADSLLTTRELVERSAQQLQALITQEPRTDPHLRLALGRVYRKMGLLDRALPLLTEAVAAARTMDDKPALADALDAHGHALSDALQYNAAVGDFTEALAIRLSQNAMPGAQAATLSGLGEAQSFSGQHEAAIASLREGLERLDADPNPDASLRLRLLDTLAVALRRADRPDSAIAVAEQAVADSRKNFGTGTREEASALSVLGSIQRHAGRLRDAAQSLRATVAIDLDTYHQAVPAHLHNLGSVLLDLGEYDEAEKVLRDALAAQVADLGADHPAVGNYQKELGLALHALGREAEAEALLRTALAHTEHGYDAQSPEVADKRLALGDVLLARGEVSAARQQYQNVIEAASMPGSGRLRLRALALAGLARDDAAVDDIGHAVQLVREALASVQAGDALEPQERILLELDAGELLLKAGERDGAGQLFEQAATASTSVLSDDHPLRARILFDQARIAQSRADRVRALELVARSLPGLQQHLPPKHPLVVAALALRDTLNSPAPTN